MLTTNSVHNLLNTFRKFSPTEGSLPTKSRHLIPSIHFSFLTQPIPYTGTNTMMMPETAKEQLLVLLKQESTVYRTYDYLRSNAFGSFSTSPSQEQRAEPNGVKKRRLMPPSSDPANDSVTKDETKKEAAMKPDWRFKMIEWAYKGEFTNYPSSCHFRLKSDV